MKDLKYFIDLYRNHKVLMNVKIRIISFLLLIMLLIFFFLTLESILYLEISSRLRIFIFMFSIILFGGTYIAIRYFFESKGKIAEYSEDYLSNEIGENDKDITDKLKNSIQLQRKNYTNPITTSLSSMAIENMLNRLEKYIYPDFTSQVMHNLKIMLAFSFPIFFIFVYYGDSYSNASERLINPTTEYPVPHPFTLTADINPSNLLEGDSLLVSISSKGSYPDSLDISWEFNNQNFVKRVESENGKFSTVIYNIPDDITYSALYKTTDFLSPWNEISTQKHTIKVIKRPKITDLSFKVEPPQYTKSEIKKLESNNTDISIIEGSKISVNASSNKNISEAWVNNNENRFSLKYSENNFSGVIDINTNSMITIHCKDTDGINNINPPSYKINIKPDKIPIMYITNPPQDFVITEKREINFEIQVIDDYGFSDAWIEYRIVVPSYLNQDTSIYKHIIPEINASLKAQEFYHKWSFGDIPLGLDDKLEFYIYIADNNNITGPGIVKSSLFTGNVPSLEDMFMELENREETIKESTKEITLNIDEVEELVNDLKMELLKSEDEMKWEQTKKVEESINKMDEVFEEIEKIQNTMQDIQEKAKENEIMDKSLLDKFSLFQEMLNEIMTPEMLEALQKLKEKMEGLDTDQMLQALENFEFDLSLMEEQLNRFIEMFERAMAEQSLEKLVQQLSEMIDNQLEILDELNNGIKPQDLSQKQESQKQKMNEVKDNIKENTENISKFSESSGKNLQQLLDSDLTKQTEEKISDTKKSMENGSKENSLNNSEQSLSGLEEMLEQSLSIQEQFLNETIDKMSKEFLSVVTSMLSIAKLQELISGSLDGVRSNSPKLKSIAKKQNVIQHELYQAMDQLLNLSSKTFHIPPKINRSLGLVQSAIQKTINNIEQKKVMRAKQEQKKILVGINETTHLLLSSLKNMQESMSSSGFSSYMDALSEMSGQQQGINQGTMQLNQMGLLGQQAMMEKLQAKQQQLQKQLGDLMSEFPEEGSGGLSKASEEMNDVIRDFIERKVNEETMDKQEKILSRMLDSHRSLTERDYNNKRKSKSGEEKNYTGPLSLPDDKGERKTLLTKALQEAMNDGYSEEYQTLLKIYFKSLENLDK